MAGSLSPSAGLGRPSAGEGGLRTHLSPLLRGDVAAAPRTLHPWASGACEVTSLAWHLVS